MTSVTWNGSETFTAVPGTAVTSNTLRLQMWYLFNPTATTADIVATWNGTHDDSRVSVQIVDGIDTGTPFGTAVTDTNASGTTLTVDVSSATGEIVVDVAGHSQAGGTATEGANQTVDTINSTMGGTAFYAHASHEDGATTVTMSYTWGSSATTQAIAAIPLKPAAAQPGPTLYFLNSANGQGYGDMQVGGSAPSTATGSTGWTVAATAADNYSKMAFGVERAASTFGGTALPNTSGPDNTLKDCFRTGPWSGSFASGDWAFSCPVIAVDAGGTQDGALRVRVWRSNNADGSSATELTSDVVQLSTVTNLTTGAAQICSGNVTLGAITHSGTDYYLFFMFAWRITGQAS
jgi:hypothetical protein